MKRLRQGQEFKQLHAPSVVCQIPRSGAVILRFLNDDQLLLIHRYRTYVMA